MKTKIIFATLILCAMGIFSSCDQDGNTGNGSQDTPIKVGSGYSDSANPEKGEFDRRQTPNEEKRTEKQDH